VGLIGAKERSDTMRLIDADDAIKCVAEIIIKKSDIELETATQQALAYDIALTHARHLINGIPTAYDVEAVVAELEAFLEGGLQCNECAYMMGNHLCRGECEQGAFAKAISIVRGKE